MESDAFDKLLNHPRMAVFARLYAAYVPLVVILTFQPLFELTEEVEGVEVTTPVRGLWAELVDTGHEISTFSIMFMLALLVLLVVGATGVRSPGVPIAIAVASLIMLMILIGRPGYSDDRTPDLGPWAQVGIAAGVIGVLIAGTHAALLIVAKRRQ